MDSVYSKSIQNDLLGIIPNMRTVKRSIKSIPSIFAKYDYFTNFGDDISIYFKSPLTEYEIEQMDAIFSPGDMEIEVYTSYQSGKVFAMVDATQTEIVDVYTSQSLTHKDLTDVTNVIDHLSIGTTAIITSGAIPLPGQNLTGQSDGSMSFQYKDSFLAYYNTDQVFPANTLTQIGMDAVLYDTNSSYANPNATIQMTNAYRVDITLYFSTVTLCYILLYKNGTSVAGYECRNVGSHSFSASLFLNSGDVLSAYVYPVAVDCDLTSFQTINSVSTRMSYMSIS